MCCCCCSCSFLTLPTPPNKSQSSPPPCPTFHTHKHAELDLQCPVASLPIGFPHSRKQHFLKPTEVQRRPTLHGADPQHAAADKTRALPQPDPARPFFFFFQSNPVSRHPFQCVLPVPSSCLLVHAHPPTHRRGPQISLDTCCGIFAPGLGPLPTRTTRIAHHSCC